MIRNALNRLWPPDTSIDRDELIAELERLLEQALTAERERCVAVCRERAAVWRRTTQARSDIPAARDEARARANEAGYLADLLEIPGAQPQEEEPN
jgi:hypothetical protein